MKKMNKSTALQIGGLVLSGAGALINYFLKKKEQEKTIQKAVENFLTNHKPNI